jgi:uroporphyrinogen III methyltransferase / synthase
MPQFDDPVQPNFTPNPMDASRSNPEGGQRTGKVYLVGAGPGDPRLITLRGAECLGFAEVVLYDGLANSQLLELATKAEKVSVGKHGTQPIWTQTQINEAMVRFAKQGKTVVRLKGGDPAVFARTAEELEALEEASIPFEVVPGITAALAVAGYTGIPLTHRNHASAVALITGQQQDDAPDELDWCSLASFPGTLVVYMGVTTSQHWTRSLIAGGKAAETPAAIVRRCSWGDQLVIRCTLSEISQHLTPASKLRPPVLVIVGEVANLGTSWNWFESRPLRGMNVWVPRPENQSLELSQLLEGQGATVFSDPVIRFRRPREEASLKKSIQLLSSGSANGITFSSANGVDYFFKYLQENGFDSRVFAGVELACVGPATSRQLEKYGLRADLQPDHEFSAASLADLLSGDRVLGQHWIVTSTNHSQDTLVSGLEASGAQVTNCLTYETDACQSISEELGKVIASGTLNLAFVTSTQIARTAKQFIGDAPVNCVAISQKVAAAMEEMGWPAKAVSPSHTTQSIYETAINHLLPNRPF